MTLPRPLVAALLAAALAACATGDAIVVNRVDIQALYSRDLVQWVGAGRDLPLRVTGNPTGLDDDAWGRTVAAAMNDTGWLPSVHLTTEPGETARGNYHVAVMFNAPGWMDDGSVCRGDTEGAELVPAGDRSMIAMAFCNEGRTISSAFASAPAIVDANAPQVRAALSQLMVQAFPRRNPNFPDRSDVLLVP